MTTKTLNDVQPGDKVVSMGTKTFERPFEVLTVTRFDPKSQKLGSGEVVTVVLEGGRFWPMQPGIAVRTEIVVL